jgi:putative transcriptional regulator
VVKVNDEDFENLTKSIQQAGEIKKGQREPGRVFEFSPMDIKEIRQRLEKSQSEFALMIGVSVGTLQNWEQGRRKPVGPARALLKIAAENPKAVREALETYHIGKE